MIGLYHVIIIDDEFLAAKNLRDMLPWGEYGFCVDEIFSDSALALDYIIRNPVDLILTDIKMPQYSGVDIAKACSALEHPPHVVFISAYSEFEYAKEAIRNRVYDYLLKPFSFSEIEEILKKVHASLKAGAAAGASDRSRQPKAGDIDFSPELLACGDPVIVKTLDFIRDNYSSGISLDNVSRHVLLSRSYFCTYFKGVTGENFVDVLNEFRVKKAKRLLSGSDIKVSAAAEAVGYKSVPYFYKIFTSHTGLTPSEYRKRHKGRAE